MKFTTGFFSSSAIVPVVAILSIGAESGYAQNLIWQNEWEVPQYLSTGYPNYANGSTNVAFSSNGEILLGAPSPTLHDDQFERIESDGTVRWSNNIGGGSGSAYNDPTSLLANADGSAYALANYGGNIVKINPDGSIAWERSEYWEYALISVSTQTIAATDCNSITLIDASTGQTLWQYEISQPASNCPSPNAVADGAGNIYAGYTVYNSNQTVSGYRCLKLDTNGTLIWDVLASPSYAVQPFGASSTLVYLNPVANNISTSNASTIVALQSSTGKQAWSASGYGLGTVASTGALIVLNGSQIESLNALTGQPNWSQNAPVATNDFFDVVNVIGNDIFLESNGSPSSRLARLDAGTGAVIWSAALPQTDSFGNGLESIAVGEIAGPAVAAVLAPVSQSSPPILEKINFATGQLLGPIAVAATAQGVNGNSTLAGSNNIAGAAVAVTPGGGQLRVRMLNSSTGTTAWETADTSTAVAVSPVATGVATGGSVVAATVDNSYWASNSAFGGYGSILVDAFDMSSGTKTWGKILFNPSNFGFAYAFSPMVDTSGNVFVPYGATTYCGSSGQQYVCGVQTLLKLSAADGSTIWEFDNGPSAGLAGYQVFPQTTVLQGTDVVLGGPFYGSYSTATLLRLSGIDGSVQWSATVPSFAANQIFDIFPGSTNIIAVGSGWANIDSATGNVLWTNAEDNPACVNPCDDYANLRLASDTILYGGENGGHAVVRMLPAAQGAQEKYFTLYQEAAGFRSFVNQIVQDSADRVWLEIVRYARSPNAPGVFLLAQFDPASGELLSQQALAGHDQSAVPDTDTIEPLLLSAPENNQLPVQTNPLQAGMPDTTGDALLNTAITANGDLALTMTTDKSVAVVGQTLTFQLTATYSGDTSISGAHLMAQMPWYGMPANLACTAQSASNCVLDTRSNMIKASFDMQPGGRVTISGQIMMTSASGTPMLRGVVYGPTGLNEQNTTNNFGYLYLNDEIFKNGFE